MMLCCGCIDGNDEYGKNKNAQMLISDNIQINNSNNHILSYNNINSDDDVEEKKSEIEVDIDEKKKYLEELNRQIELEKKI